MGRRPVCALGAPPRRAPRRRVRCRVCVAGGVAGVALPVAVPVAVPRRHARGPRRTDSESELESRQSSHGRLNVDAPRERHHTPREAERRHERAARDVRAARSRARRRDETFASTRTRRRRTRSFPSAFEHRGDSRLGSSRHSSVERHERERPEADRAHSRGGSLCAPLCTPFRVPFPVSSLGSLASHRKRRRRLALVVTCWQRTARSEMLCCTRAPRDVDRISTHAIALRVE